MTTLPIVLWPDARLSRACAEVAHGADMRALAQDMLDTMYAAPGRGLAGPQVGEMRRIFVMDTTWKEGTPSPRICLNPEITWRSDAVAVHAEGCLSIPGITAEVPRPAEIRMTWYDQTWDRHEAHLTGFDAVCAQHEFDHLEGRVYLDYMTPARRAALEAEYAP